MKKLYLLLALLLIGGLCFAQDSGDGEEVEQKRDKLDLEITIGVPIHWTNSPGPHGHWDEVANAISPVATVIGDEDKTVTANTAIGVSLLFNFGKKMGFLVDWDFSFGSTVMGHSSTDSYANSLFGSNILLGPVLYLYNGSFLRIPLAIGVHGYYWSSDSWLPEVFASGGAGWIKLKDFQAGPGLYLGIQFHFSDSLYIFSRTNVAFDIFRWHQIMVSYDNAGTNDTYDSSWIEWATSWSVKPTIGIGIKF
jgi:hypothetical protein